MLQQLDASERVLVTSHARPDGDAVGSTAALVLALRAKGKQAEVLMLTDVPRRYAFVFEEAGLEPLLKAPHLGGFDTLLVVDTGTFGQLPGLAEKIPTFAGTKLVIDHHITQENWHDTLLHDTSAAAACEMVHGLLLDWDVPITPAIAQAVYVGMATDTGWFAFSSTTARTLRAAADCLEKGVNLDALFQRLRQSDRPARLDLWRRGLASLEYHAEGRVAAMTLRQSDYEEAAATGDEAEDLVNEPLRVAAVRASVIFGEQTHGDRRPIKVSIRTKGEIDAAAICQRFGGGGHARAAGCRIDAPLDDVQQQVLAALTEALPSA